MRLTETEIKEITKSVFGINENPIHPDLIFIFGGTDPNLWKFGFKKYMEFGLPDILVTGGNKKTNKDKHPDWKYGELTESVIISSKLKELGVDKTKILIENNSTNSLENAINSVKEFDLKKYKEILLITRSHGAGRQLRTFKSNYPYKTKISVFTFDGLTNGKDKQFNLSSSDWHQHPITYDKIVKEYEKLLIYSAKGDFNFERKAILRIENKLKEENKISS